MNQLEIFFNNFLARADISKSPMLLPYFTEQAEDKKKDIEKIRELSDYLEKKQNSSKAAPL